MDIQSFPRRLALWAVLCSLSAAPSFVWAIGAYDPAAMGCGISIFILAYAVASGTTTVARIKSRPFARRTFLIGYITRVGISVTYPVGMALDMLPGMISKSIVESIVDRPEGFLGTLMTTVVQGAFLNVILAVYMGAIYLLQCAFLRVPVTEGLCRRCGYDLRSSPIRCPECGEPAPGAETPAMAVDGH